MIYFKNNTTKVVFFNFFRYKVYFFSQNSYNLFEGVIMESIKKGDVLKIQCYKHNGQIYRNWDETLVIEVNDSFIVCANNAARVTEIDGRKWTTKEPAIIFFYKNKWFNIISQFKKNGIYYYCNIATPYIIEDKTIKYIDYDLDLRVFPDKTFRVLDKGEYEYHKEKMNYSEEIDKVVNYELNNLINIYKDSAGPFDQKFLDKYYNIYIEMQKNKEKV